MKRVKIKKFKDYKFEFTGPSRLLSHNYRFLYPRPIIVIFIFLFFSMSLFNLEYLPYFIALTSVYFYTVFVASRHSKSVEVKRVYNQKSKEERDEVFNYQIKNPYSFKLDNILLIDSIQSSTDQRGKSEYYMHLENANANSITHESIELNMNNGMGTKQLGPFVAVTSDPLGIHQISFIDSAHKQMNIMPKVYPTKVSNTKPDTLSNQFGLFDSHTKGENVNFYSTREYTEGDNVKKINWKLSLKNNKIIVNEFEKNINGTTYAILIDDNRIHFGSGRISTLEYCKDIILSLFYQSFKHHNSLGFLSHQSIIKAKTGVQHVQSLERRVANFGLKTFDRSQLYHKGKANLKEAKNLERKVIHYVNRTSQVYMAIPFISGKVFNSYIESAKALTKRGYTIHIVIVYGFRSVLKYIEGENRIWLSKFQATIKEDLTVKIEYIKKSGMQVSIVEIDDNMKRGKFIKEAFNVT